MACPYVVAYIGLDLDHLHSPVASKLDHVLTTMACRCSEGQVVIGTVLNKSECPAVMQIIARVWPLDRNGTAYLQNCASNNLKRFPNVFGFLNRRIKSRDGSEVVIIV